MKVRFRQKMNPKIVVTIVSGLLVFAIFFIYSNFFNSDKAYAAVSYTWNGSADSSWTNDLNWTPNGVPGSADNVTIGLVSTRDPILFASLSLNNLTLNNGAILDLNGFNLSVNGTITTNAGSTIDLSEARLTANGNAIFNGGAIIDSDTLGSLYATGSTSTFGSGSNGPTFDVDVHVSSATIRIANSTFNDIAEFEKTGTSNDQSAGNNIFNGKAIFSTNNSGYLLMSSSKNDIYNDDITLNSYGNGIIYLAYRGTGTVFNGDIIVNNTGTGGVRIGASTGTSELAANKKVIIGALGFDKGMLMLANMNFPTTDSTNFSLASNAVLTLGPGTSFNGDVVAEAGGICLSGATFNASALITKTGSSNDRGAGSNIYNGVTSITNNGTGYLLMSNNYPDTFNTEVTFSSMNTGLIYPCYNGTGSVFNDNIIVNSTVGGGIRIGASSGTSTIADTKRVIVGTEGFDAGTLILGNFTSSDTSAFTLALNGSSVLTLGPNSSFAGEFSAEAGGICLNGATMNKASTFKKTGTTNDQGTGSNVFNGPALFINEGSGYLMMSASQNDIFNAEVSFNCKGSGIIYPAYRGTQTQFNDNIIVNCTGTGGIRIGANVGSSELAPGKQLIVGPDGFSSGTLTLGNFTSFNTDLQEITLTGNSVLTLGPASSFEGDLITVSGGLCLNGTTFNGKATFTKTGSTNDQGTGNNIFNDTMSVTNEGSGYVLMSNTTRDVYNYPATFSSLGNGIVYVAYRGTDTEFNEEVIVNSTGGGGVRIGASSGTSRIAAGKSIKVGSHGFSGGTFMLANFTSPGTDPQDLLMSGSSILSVGPSTYFGGNVNAESGGLCFNGVTIDGVSRFIKTGSSNDQGTGNNIFNDSLSIINQGTGYVLMSSSTRDVFNAPASFSSLGNGIIYVAYRGTDTEFNDNITISSTGGGGIRIGASTGTSRIAAGKMINVGSDGFSGGQFMLANYTSPGASPQNFNFTGSSLLTLGPSTTFAGDVNAECGGICLSGVTILGASSFTKTGSSNDQGTGNNIFTGPTSITNTGTGYILLSSSKKDIYQSDVNYTITNSGIIYVSYNGVDNEFNGDIYLNSTGLGSIRFGSSTGTSKLAPGKKVNIGSFGFSGGYVQFNKFEQDGGTPQVLDVSTGNASIYFNSGSVFDGDVNIRFPQIYLNGSVFNGTTTIEKTGPGNNAGTGGNTFNGITTIKNSGSGILYLANSSGDDFNNHVNFVQSGTGALRPAHNGTSTFSADISTLGSTGVVTFAASGGTVALDGTSLQNINGSAVYTPVFRRLNINNGGAGVKLNVPISVSVGMTLNNGIVSTTNTNILSIENGVSAVSGGSNLSYIDGPLRKVGTQAFTFPTGKDGLYRPISMSAPTGATSSFTAEYFKKDPGLLYNVLSLVLSIKKISRCEYWSLQRTSGVSNVNVTLGWDASTCPIGTPSDLKIAGWDPLFLLWKDFGSTATSGNSASGTISSGNLVTSFGVFTFGSTNANVSLPVELTDFTAAIVGDKTLVSWQTASEINNDYFTVERSADGQYFEAIGLVEGSGNTTNSNSYSFTDDSPLGGTSFYRLRQTDYDGKFEIFEPVSVNFKGMNTEFRVESVGPNPFTDNIRIDYFSPDNSELTLVVTGLDGSLAYTSRVSATGGSGSISTGQLPELSSGIYILKLLKGDVILDTRKMVRN
ncbi:MAG TPA: hypothetical protein PKM97_04640 [Bacteroidia bacterium]|nr:hypothetical protein [Bacteroidia bacterium]